MKIAFLAILGSLFFLGCSSKEVRIVADEFKTKVIIEEQKYVPSYLKTKESKFWDVKTIDDFPKSGVEFHKKTKLTEIIIHYAKKNQVMDKIIKRYQEGEFWCYDLKVSGITLKSKNLYFYLNDYVVVDFDKNYEIIKIEKIKI